MSNSHILELAQAISADSTAFENDLRIHNLPSLSLDQDAPLDLPLSPEAKALRIGLLSNIEKLKNLLLGPPGMMLNDFFTMADWMTSQALNRYNVTRAFPPGGEATYEEVAKKSGLSEKMTKRLVRHAMTRGIFREKQQNVLEHTSVSRFLAEDPRMQDFVAFIADEIWPGTTKLTDALEKWHESEEPCDSGWNLVTGETEPIWAVLDKVPERGRRFAKVMEFFQLDTAYDVSHIVNNYAWDSVGNGTIVDIGGSSGSVMTAVCKKYPNVRAIVQDLPVTVEKGRSEISPEVSDRVEFMVHDFFAEQPVKGADIYMFRWILHDWSDTYVVKILKALAPAMREGSKLLIWDALVPAPGEAPRKLEQDARAFDLIMLSVFNGKEREAEQWPKILHDADPRFHMLAAKQPPGSGLGLVEIVWKP